MAMKAIYFSDKLMFNIICMRRRKHKQTADMSVSYLVAADIGNN